MDKTFTIQPITSQNLPEALALAWDVFQKFEAPEYSKEGVQEFKNFINEEVMAKRIAEKDIYIWGAYHGNTSTGMIAAKPSGHISLLFVDEKYHRQGIARALTDTVIQFLKERPVQTLTVHSSPYAHPVYQRFGFQDINTEQTLNGIRFIPMKREL